MRLRPDLQRTATGYWWLDRLTAPWWRWQDLRAQRSLYRVLGVGDETEGRRILKDACWEHFIREHGLDP